MRKLFIFCVLLIFLIPIFPLHAQDAIEIAIGESVTVNLSSSATTQSYAFEATAGDVLYIATVEFEVPTEIRVFGPGGGILAESISTPSGSLVESLNIESDGRYIMAVSRPSWSQEEGEVFLIVDHRQFEAITLEDNEFAHEGYLPGIAALHQFSVTFNAGDLIHVRLYASSSNFTLVSPSGQPYNTGFYDDSSIGLMQMKESGEYKAYVQTAYNEGVEYSLSIDLVEADPITSNTPIKTVVGDTFPRVFTFDAVAGKMWDISADVPLDGSRYLQVFRFENRELWESEVARDDGTGPGRQARIRPFIAPEDGTYYIVLWYDDEDSDYNEHEATINVSPSTLISIAPGSELRGESNSETGMVQYHYAGTAGQKIHLTFTRLSEAGGLALTLVSSEDEVFTFSGRNATSAAFDIELPLDDNYQFFIRNVSYDSTSNLQFSLLLELVGN